MQTQLPGEHTAPAAITPLENCSTRKHRPTRYRVPIHSWVSRVHMYTGETLCPKTQRHTTVSETRPYPAPLDQRNLSAHLARSTVIGRSHRPTGRRPACKAWQSTIWDAQPIVVGYITLLWKTCRLLCQACKLCVVLSGVLLLSGQRETVYPSSITIGPLTVCD